jgi:hypothetical protein
MPELNRPPSTDCGLFTLGINQFHAHSNAILKDFVKLGDREGAGQFLPEPDMNSSPEPVVQKTALDDIPAQRQAQPEMRERQSSGPAIWRLPPSTNRGFSGRDTDIPSLAEIKALHSRPRKGGAEIPPNPNSGPPMVQTKNVHDISARRQAAIANPFPFPFIEDSDDEIIIEVKSRSSVVTNVGTYNTGIPFSSPIIEDDWG